MRGSVSLRSAGRRGRTVIVLASYLVLTLALTYPLVRQFSRAIPGDGFDGWQNFWNLWWVKTALLQQHTHPYFTDLLYYPTGVSLLFHTLNPLNGLLSLPVQVAWGLFPAYNVIVLFSFTLSGFGAYLLARWILGPSSSRFPAFVAGLIFAFAPFHFAHLLGHMQVISLEWIPFYALYLMRIAQKSEATRSTLHDIVMATLFLVLIALCDWYYVLYCLILTLVVALWVAWHTWRRKGRTEAPTDRAVPAERARSRRSGLAGLVRGLIAFALVWVMFAVILSPLLGPMIAEASRSQYMVPDPGQSRTLSADLLAYVTPQEFHPLWGAQARDWASVFTATVSEHQVFAGFTVLALAGLGAWAGWARQSARRPRLGPWPLAFLVFLVLSLGPVLHIAGRTALLPGGSEVPLPYAWLARIVPFMEITRSVSRFDAVVMLSLAVMAACGVQWLWRRGTCGRVGGLLAAGLILFEFWPAPYPMSPSDTPAWYTALAADPRAGAVLNLPMDWDRPGYLLHQTVHGKPLTTAYISREDPRTLADRVPVLQQFRHLGPDIIRLDLGRQGVQMLNDLGVRWVVLDRYQMPGEPERSYNETTARSIFGDQPPAYQDERITVYEVMAPTVVEPYLVLGPGWEPYDSQTGSRAFVGTASIILRAPEAQTVKLAIKLAPGSPPLDLPAVEGVHSIALHLQPGDTEYFLRAADPGQRVVVTEIALES